MTQQLFPPVCIRLWMQHLMSGAAVPKQTLERSLLGPLNSDEASQAVEDATNMGILVAQGKGMRSVLSFCQKLKSIPTSLADRYCYECNLPGALTGCKSCSRSFHVFCQRKHPEKPTYDVPSDKGQPYRFPLNESDTDGETARKKKRKHESLPMELQLDHNSNISISHLDRSTPLPSVKRESPDWYDDVSFVSEQPAARTRKKSKVKTEQPPIVEPDSSSDLENCTACRLMTLARIQHPPHLDKEELSCVLRYSWAKHQSWLITDVEKYMNKHLNSRDRALVKRILFKTNTLGQAAIERNIEAKKYKYLTELFVDLLDLQHNIGVFFGPTEQEYNATQWLMRDVTHDIREIRLCPDCFRNSNEMDCSMWFAKPCLQRHEVVFAKQAGWPHWPAKVISVSSKKPIKYDVRFFGKNHLRASVLEKDIIPIEADVPFKQKAKMSKALVDAMRELECHKMLSNYSADLFGFHADPAATKEAIDKALSHCPEPTITAAPAKRVRPCTPAISAKRPQMSAATPTPVPTRLLPQRRLHLAAHIAGRDERDEPMTGNDELHNLRLDLIDCQDKLLEKTEALAALRKEMIDSKRKRWCQLCLQAARFDCCFNASYCSSKCQSRHKKLHKRVCKAKH
ncbi:zinc finger MYND domain-containing protein 11 [Drosophila obscura]|uniref:zinc finger MYND domain-containing protein 11 n=1 Tax=Drosophila obscura TaxID=7282 RepID=UPI001BB2CF19|nr:zinc finger MYND domain-containing protein 11 [Drosophila obscura]